MTARIITDYWPKPIPLRWYDWSATYDDYDGTEDSGNRGHIGHGATEAAAVIDLIENHPRGIQCERDHIGGVNEMVDALTRPQLIAWASAVLIACGISVVLGMGGYLK